MKRTLLAAFLLVGSLQADTVFDFANDSIGTTASFTDTSNGLSATFSNAVPAYGAAVASVQTAPLSFTGVVPSPALLVGNSLFFYAGNGIDITFSQDVVSATFDFLDYDEYYYLTASALESGVATGATVTVTPAAVFNYSDLQATVQVSGLFNGLYIGLPNGGNSDSYFGNLDVVTATPEPSTIGMIGMSSLLVGLGCWRLTRQRVI